MMETVSESAVVAVTRIGREFEVAAAELCKVCHNAKAVPATGRCVGCEKLRRALLLEDVECARPRCNRMFKKGSGDHVYCTTRCRQLAEKERDQANRGEDRRRPTGVIAPNRFVEGSVPCASKFEHDENGHPDRAWARLTCGIGYEELQRRAAKARPGSVLKWMVGE